MDNTAEAIVVIDKGGIITDFNAAAEELFGYSAGEVVGHNVGELMPSPYRDEHDTFLARYLKTGKTWIMDQRRELPGRRKDGSIIPLEFTVTKISHLGLFCAMIRDLKDQRALERQIADISAQERERIGRDIHDGLGQKLTGLSMMATSLKHTLAGRNLPEANEMDEMIVHLQQTIREARDLSHGLAPVPITSKGLEHALKALAENVHTTTGVNCRFESHRPVDIEDRTAAVNLYRITQEAINNALKHSHARNINIKLGDPDNDALTIHDDGDGFQMNEAIAKGFGLRILRYRAGTIGYYLDIESMPGKGTTIQCKRVAAMPQDISSKTRVQSESTRATLSHENGSRNMPASGPHALQRERAPPFQLGDSFDRLETAESPE